MTRPSDQPPSPGDAGASEALDRYLDGLMDEPERAAFEARIAQSADLRGVVEMQRRADARLRVIFALPTDGQQHAIDIAGKVDGKPVRPWWVRWGAVAAVLVLGAVFVAMRLGTFETGPAPVTLAGLYKAEVQAGFQPREVCTDPVKFRGWLVQHFGQALELENPPTGLQLVGWDYSTVLSPYTGVLLAKFNGQPIVVVIDRLGADKRQLSARAGSLHVYRAVVGRLVAYEVSPLPEAAVIDRFRVATEQKKPGEP